MTNDPGTQAASAAAQHFSTAVAHFKAGRHQLALQLAEQLIPAYPGNAQLLSLTAACARELRFHEKAEIYLHALISAQPDSAAAYNDLGMLFMHLRRLAEAESLLEEALRLDPRLVEALVNRGNLLCLLARPADAEAAYRRAIALQPNHAIALYNLGLLLEKQKRIAEAESVFRLSLAVNPDQADVLTSLGTLLTMTRRDAEAEAAYREVIRLKPGSADAHFNLAVLLLEDRRPREAIAALRHALDADPRHANALNCFGNVMAAIGQFEKAEMAYRRALELSPDSANVHNNLGNLLFDSGKLVDAEDHFRQALILQPDYGHALGQAATCARHRCDWSQESIDGTAIVHALEQGVEGVSPFMVLSLPEATPMHHRQAAILAAKKHLVSHVALPARADLASRESGRLRIGYLSADFHAHATMYLLRGVFANHDRQAFSIHAYSYGPILESDPYQKQLHDECDSFVNIQHMSDQAAAERIADDDIDILVDLKGFTRGYRLGITAKRPAPIIVNWLGYPGTLGDARLADYIIGDPTVTPLEHAWQFSETIAQLPDCYQPNDSNRVIGPCPTRQEAGLPENGFVFCSFNRANKLTEEAFNIWCRLLDQVPGSILWLLDEFPAAKDSLWREAALRGIAAERLVFAPAMHHAEHLGRLKLADLALDTFPYTSHTTGSDVLWAGVPMVSLRGNTFVSRVSSSLLYAVNLPELVTDTWQDYFALALSLASNKDKLDELRRKLAVNRLTAPLFDTGRFTRNLEALYTRMWSDHASGLRTPISLTRAKA